MSDLLTLKLLRDLQEKVQTTSKEAGPTGPVGDVGPTGAQGPQGSQGPTGSIGERGPEGPAGADGTDGTDGADGRGVESVSQAADGDLIITLSDGTEEIIELPTGLSTASEKEHILYKQGYAGSGEGTEGPEGPKGDDGDRGPKGDDGDRGPKGDDGDEGPKGDDGDEGPKGDDGTPGTPGTNGTKWFSGSGQPSPEIGDNNDYYLDGTSGFVYIKRSSGWIPTGDNLMGPQGPPGTGGTSTSSSDIALSYAKGAGLAVEQGLLAAAGQPAKTVLAVGATDTGKVQGCSLGDGNVVEVYASGADYNKANVLHREFMGAGEPICFTGIQPGAIITSTQGFYGMGEQVAGSQVSPMPLMSLGLSFTDTFVFAFRNSQADPGTGADSGQIIICNGTLPSSVTLYRFRDTGEQKVVLDQENIALEPFELAYLYTEVNGEYRVVATNPVMGAIQARMGTSPPLQPGDAPAGDRRFYDARLIMPLTNDGLTWPRSGNVSAPYDNTEAKYYVRDGVTGDFPTVNPGSPVDFDAGSSTGANDSDYEPRGATRLRVSGLVSAYSGADSAGLEASPMIPTAAMSQVVAQPFWVHDSGDGGSSGVSIASMHKGTARVYQWDPVTKVAVLAYTVPLDRGTAGQGIAPTSPEDQYIPCAGMVANEPTLAADTSVIPLEGNLGPGYVVADVPITVIAQNNDLSLQPEIRSQAGTVTTSIKTNDDETLMLGWTPAQKKAEITEDADGYTRRRVLDNTGAVTWPLT